MTLTCAQMDVLISFYIDGDLSQALKKQVEEHFKSCATCRAKYDIIKNMLNELKNNFEIQENSSTKSKKDETELKTSSQQYRLFKSNLSAYIDNELGNEENIKIKKFAINNSRARQDLEDNYNIRKLMNDSFQKTKNESRIDFSRNILRQLELEEEATSGIHPVIKLLIGFTLSALTLASIILISLTA